MFCAHRRFPCFPWNGGDLTCTAACGYTAQCASYTEYEFAWCAKHPDQYLSGHGKCTKGGDPWWNTYCIDFNVSKPPTGMESSAAYPELATPPVSVPGVAPDFDPNEPSSAAYPDVE